MPAPFRIDKSTKTTGKVGGKTVPLAWDVTTGNILQKTFDSMPWGDDTALAAIQTAGGQYINDDDVFFRGVWEPAPPTVFDANPNSADDDQKALAGGAGRHQLPDKAIPPKLEPPTHSHKSA